MIHDYLMKVCKGSEVLKSMFTTVTHMIHNSVTQRQSATIPAYFIPFFFLMRSFRVQIVVRAYFISC